jgi:hypothetical protein
MAARRKTAGAARRVRHLVSLDAATIMARLRGRQEEMVSIFSRTRDRSPLLGAIHSLQQTMTFTDLVSLEPAEQRAVSQFYETLGELRWYLQYTEDMPLQIRQRVTLAMTELETNHRRLVQAVGAPDGDGAPVVDGTVSRPAAEVTALAVPASRSGR